MKLSHYLYVFNHVISQGEKRESVFYDGELSAWHDFDGYTCWIAYKDLTITLLFHGRFDIDYKYEDTLKQFYQKVNVLIVNQPK